MIEIDDETLDAILNSEIEPYESHIRSLVASTIESNITKKILKASTSACQDCINVFHENTTIWDTFIAKKNRTKEIKQPCLSTVNIIAVCDAVFEILQPKGYVDFNVMVKTIQNSMPLHYEEMYGSTAFETHQTPGNQSNSFSHQEQFVHDVVCEYMHLKSQKIGKRINIEELNGRAIRKSSTRKILVAGQ